jgi:hypothetical protein
MFLQLDALVEMAVEEKLLWPQRCHQEEGKCRCVCVCVRVWCDANLPTEWFGRLEAVDAYHATRSVKLQACSSVGS